MPLCRILVFLALYAMARPAFADPEDEIWWTGNQSDCVVLTPHASSWFHGNNWLNYTYPSEILENGEIDDIAIFDSDFDPQNTNNFPRHMYFGDFKTSFSGPCSSPLIPGGQAIAHDLYVNGGPWLFDFGSNVNNNYGDLNVEEEFFVGGSSFQPPFDDGSGATSNATLLTLQGNGTLTTQFVRLGHQPETNVSVTLQGEGAVWRNGGVFDVVNDATLHVESGARLETGFARVGDGGTDGLMVVTGENSRWEPHAGFNIGSGGIGQIVVRDGAAIMSRGGIALGSFDGHGTLRVGGFATQMKHEGEIVVFDGLISVTSGASLESTVGNLFLSGESRLEVTGEGTTFAVEQALYVAHINSGHTQYVVQDGAVASSSALSVGIEPQATGFVEVTGDDSLLSVTNVLTLGSSGSGTLEISAGGHVTSNGVVIGDQANSIGAATVRGTNSIWVNGEQRVNDFNVGRIGEGRFQILDGGHVNVMQGNTFVGRESAGDGRAVVSGAKSSWQNQSLIVGGSIGSTGDIVVEKGALVQSADQIIVGSSGHGTVIVRDGAKLVSSKLTSPTSTSGVIGRFAGSDGVLTVTGAGSQWLQDGFISVGSEGIGGLQILAGGEVQSLGARIGRNPGSSGTVAVKGSGTSWSIGDALIVGGTESSAGGSALLTVAQGASVAVAQRIQMWDSGVIDVSNEGSVTLGGSEQAEGGVVLIGSGGTLLGTGHILGDLQMDGGSLEPGASTGTLSVSGSFTQLDGLLTFDVGGTLPGIEYNQVQVGGDVALHGTIEMVFSESFLPSPGQSFHLIATDSLFSSTESELHLLGLPADLVMAAVFVNGTLSFLDSPLIGDTDHDGIVGLADLNNVRNNFGANGSALLGDTNLDDAVNLADLNNVRNNFGSSALSTLVVPEPNTATLAMACIVSLTAAIKLPIRRHRPPTATEVDS